MANKSLVALLKARKLIEESWGEIQPHAALVCGSGWGEILQGLSPVSSISYDKLPSLGSTTIAGHPGKLWLAKPNGIEVLIFQGRRHFYEGEGWEPVIFPALLAHNLGVKNLLLTNAAGGIRKDLQPGDLMVLSDHLNFMGDNPLIGKVPHPSISRFPDQSQIYNANLRDKFLEEGKAIGINLKIGCYLAISGPAFETPAEILAFEKLGADAVGMSTVPEAMVANGLGMKVAAISCISNLAAGRSTQALSHEDVQKTSEEVLPKMTSLLAHLLPALA
jgi:purine-nucleoside phosphorylase